jgi:lysophospholipase L1-like esterase
MSPRRRRPSLTLLATLVLAAVAVAAAAVVLADRGSGDGDAGVRGAANLQETSLPGPGVTDTSSCVDPLGNREWRVTWRTAASAAGPVLTATALSSRPRGGAWTDESAKTWELRWSTPPLKSDPFGTLLPEQTLQGPLTVLARQRTPAKFSPRFVSPDGGCTVFAVPFGLGPEGGRKVAIIGDSLVGQLGHETDLTAPPQVAAPLLRDGQRVEVNGQGGRRWTSNPDTRPGLAGADGVMTDEIRGLRGADAHVIALGTNDAGWASMATSLSEFELRLAWVLLHLEPVIDEIAASGQCTVLVTAGDRKVSYINHDEKLFARAAGEINDLLRERAAADPDDGLRLLDWAATSRDHHTGDPEPWFGKDTVHLNEAGRARYAAELSGAASLCP